MTKMSSKSKPPTTKFFAEPVVITDNFHPKNQQLEPQTLKFIRYHQKIETFDDYIKTELGRKFVKVDAKYLSHNDPESSSHTDVPKQFWDDKKWDINFYKWVKDNPDKITYVDDSNNGKNQMSEDRYKALSKYFLRKGCDCGNDPCTKYAEADVEYTGLRPYSTFVCYSCGLEKSVSRNQLKYMQTHGNKIICPPSSAYDNESKETIHYDGCWRGDYTCWTYKDILDENGNPSIGGAISAENAEKDGVSNLILKKDGQLPSHVENLMSDNERAGDMTW